MDSWFNFCRPARLHRLVCLLAGAVCMGGTAGRAAETETAYFESQIRPILREHCLDCHGATAELEGSLDLRLVRFMLSGGDSGPAIVPGDSARSYLIERVTSGDMPPGKAKLSDQQIELLSRWVDGGAATLREEPESIGPGIPLTEEERSYWAYQPLAVVPSEGLPSGERIRTQLDALIATAMPEGLSFSPDADRATQIRRLYYDLLGLPPSAAELENWLSHSGGDWYEQLVDHLLRSPHYGQRWARHWLDAAGYADSDGSTLADAGRPWAWRYRDYVIRSLNDDKPFDQFIVEQLAGDELAGPADGDWTEQQIELLTATGFLRMAADGTGSGDNSPEARNKTIADTLQIIGSTLLGSSLHCAQCHDHRYDPISHRDYFAIRAVFEPALDWQNWKTPGERLVSLATEADRQLAAEIEAEAQEIATERNQKQAEYMQQALAKELEKFAEPLRGELRAAYETAADQRSDQQKALLDSYPSVNITPGVLYQYLPDAAEDLKKYDARIGEVRSRKPADSYLQALVEPAGHQPTTRLFHRGDHNQPTDEVAPGGLAVLAEVTANCTIPADDDDLPTSGRRLAFARWLTDSQQPNPLLARALVNRIWLHHFGHGIVATPGDLGRLGSQPTHPQVLDWLAREWVASGWSLKQLHRLIVTSTVFRQSSARRADAEAIDPENQFYWRKPLLRLDAEILRDSILALSGDLNQECYGPPVPVQEDDTGQVRIDPTQPRRSIFATWRRTQPVAMLQMFDAPVMNVNCDVRPSSTVATQALLMMNGEFILDQAVKMAARAAELAESGQISPPVSLALPKSPETSWRYGTGELDEDSGVVTRFQPLPHFTGSSWQGGVQLPDDVLGWVILTAQGGHPGKPTHPAIRRWIAPADGVLAVAGSLEHGSEHGDGVRARVSTQSGVVGSWSAKQGAVATAVSEIPIGAGQAVDFIVDCLEHETSDSFTWKLELTLQTADGSWQQADSAAQFAGPPEDYSRLPAQLAAAWQLILMRPPTEIEWQAVAEFAQQQLELLHQEPGRTAEGLTAVRQVLTNACQMLIGSNEFLYVD